MSDAATPKKFPKGLIVRLGLLTLSLLLVVDMVRFGHRAETAVKNAPTLTAAEAIVVLTGGGARIARSVEMATELELPLFVSGVNPDVKSEDVARAAGVDEAFFACCVTLGRKAKTTAENGIEIAAWARAHSHDEIVVVTSSYHLERALLELQRAMPEAALTGYAVVSPVIRTDKWWTDARSARRMVLEWAKWRVVSLRESLAGR